MPHVARVGFVVFALASVSIPFAPALAAPRFSAFKAHPPVHIVGKVASAPKGLSPAQIKMAYNLPSSGGSGSVIAIIDAFHDANIERDLGVFDTQFKFAACTIKNGCLEQHEMSTGIKTNAGWSYETSLDVEWAHAMAPQAKILLIESKSGSGTDLLAAVDYARKRAGVTSISMSWGGSEFSDEATYDVHFASSTATFFASSGDDGAGVEWPAVSPYVVSVGGTTLNFATSSGAVHETAWSGSGGGVSAYEKQPAYQTTYAISRAKGMRAVPDVSFNADPATGYAVYRSTSAKSTTGWYVLGGTSAGAPQWAAINALGRSVSSTQLYADKSGAANKLFFRDITSGSNGDCTYFCEARKHYDYVTGLGSPLTVHF